MGLVSTIKAAFAASSQSADRSGRARESRGAYWCHDCAERVRDVDVDTVEEPPSCPACGEEMTFERSPGTTGCAC